jgi:hypothetical protein
MRPIEALEILKKRSMVTKRMPSPVVPIATRIPVFAWACALCVLFYVMTPQVARSEENICRLLSAQVASNVLHGPVKQVGTASACDWVRDDQTSSLLFTVDDGTGLPAHQGPSKGEIVKDIGESAVWYSDPLFELFELDVYAKHRTITVLITKPGATVPVAINDRKGCIAVAADILRHLETGKSW